MPEINLTPPTTPATNVSESRHDDSGKLQPQPIQQEGLLQSESLSSRPISVKILNAQTAPSLTKLDESNAQHIATAKTFVNAATRGLPEAASTTQKKTPGGNGVDPRQTSSGPSLTKRRRPNLGKLSLTPPPNAKPTQLKPFSGPIKNDDGTVRIGDISITAANPEKVNELRNIIDTNDGPQNFPLYMSNKKATESTMDETAQRSLQMTGSAYSDDGDAHFKSGNASIGATQLVINGQRPLTANHVVMAGKTAGIAMQYPTEADMSNVAKAIVQEKVAVVVDLLSDDDRSKISAKSHKLSFDWFSSIDEKKPMSLTGGGTIKKISDQSGDDGSIKRGVFLVTTGDGGNREITVISKRDWPDMNKIPTSDLNSLAESVSTAKSEHGGVAMVNCRAGLGRTGVLLTAVSLVEAEDELTEENKNSAVFDRIIQGRVSRHINFVSTTSQEHSLYLLADELAKKMPPRVAVSRSHSIDILGRTQTGERYYKVAAP